MTVHTFYGVVAIATAMLITPDLADAQQRRGDSTKSATPAPSAEQADHKGRTEPPAGLVGAFENRTPPEALQQRFPGLLPPPLECYNDIRPVDGSLQLVWVCDGEIVDPPGSL